MFGELTEADFHIQLWNINHMGNEAKDNSSKDFLNVSWDQNKSQGLKPCKVYDDE